MKSDTKTSFVVEEHGGINPQKETAKMVAKHFSAYVFVRPNCANQDVLEIGHGDGYGSYHISDVGKSVVGIDLFEKNVIAAANKYKRSNLQYKAMNATDLDFENESFDVAMSFQVIEHIPRKLLPKYITEIKNVLRPGGRAYISTLNLKKNLKRGVEYNKSPHHDKEFTPEEYIDFLSPKFRKVEVYGLYPGPMLAMFERIKKWGIFKGFPAKINPVSNFYENIRPHHFKWIKKDNLDSSIDLMAVCTK